MQRASGQHKKNQNYARNINSTNHSQKYHYENERHICSLWWSDDFKKGRYQKGQISKRADMLFGP
jgi:hypothetical protein